MNRVTFKFLLKSHRLLGLFLIAFILLLSVTGIALNHTDSLGLSKHSVPGFIASRYYSGDAVLGFAYGERHVYALSGQLHIDRLAITSCKKIQGLVALDSELVVLCDGELLLFTPEFEFIERMGVALGLPDGVSGLAGLANADGWLALRLATGAVAFNPAQLETRALTEQVSYAGPGIVPTAKLEAEAISWQQFILDLHSGMFAGNAGKWLMDLVAILLIVMALSGFLMWRRFH